MIKTIKILLIFVVLVSCSMGSKTKKTEAFEKEALVSKIEPKWYETVERFKLQDIEGAPVAHSFFDLKPMLDKKDESLQFVVAIPESSPYLYDLDMKSGRHYLSKKYCSQGYKSYEGIRVDYPPFTMGIIPRHLDQLNKPQKIIVFGMDKGDFKDFQNRYYEAKILGGYIEKICSARICKDKDQWLSRLVLIGVNKDYPYQTMQDLLKNISLDEMKAFIELGNGANFIAGEFVPKVSFSSFIDKKMSFEIMKKHSLAFSLKKIKDLKLSCYKLYDHSYNLYEKTKEKFSKIFYDHYEKFSKEYKTCFEYVYPANINHDQERFRYFANIEALVKLHDLGYFFNCNRNIWDENPLTEKNKRVYSFKEMFKFCSEDQFNKSFISMYDFIARLKLEYKKSLSFISYDSGMMGTHNKLYSWVVDEGNTLNCASKEDRDFSLSRNLFPEDFYWGRK